MRLLNKIREILNSSTKTKNPDFNWIPKENAIYFHEDMANQVEFCPFENSEFLNSENETINDFAKENQDGFGFKNIYERKENPKKIIDEKIDFDQLDKMLLENNMKKYDEIYEGYGQSSWKCKNTFAYKLPEIKNATIFILTDNNFVKEFWIDGFRFHENESEKQKLKNILSKIGIEYNLILNDWYLCEKIDLHKEREIDKYLNEEF